MGFQYNPHTSGNHSRADATTTHCHYRLTTSTITMQRGRIFIHRVGDMLSIIMELVVAVLKCGFIMIIVLIITIVHYRLDACVWNTVYIWYPEWTSWMHSSVKSFYLAVRWRGIPYVSKGITIMLCQSSEGWCKSSRGQAFAHSIDLVDGEGWDAPSIFDP